MQSLGRKIPRTQARSLCCKEIPTENKKSNNNNEYHATMNEDILELRKELNKAIRKYTDARDKKKYVDQLKYQKQIEGLQQRIKWLEENQVKSLNDALQYEDQETNDKFSVFALGIYLLADCLENSGMEMNDAVKKLTQSKRMKNYTIITDVVDAARKMRIMIDHVSSEQDQDDVTEFSEKLNIKVRAFAQKWLDRQKKRKEKARKQALKSQKP